MYKFLTILVFLLSENNAVAQFTGDNSLNLVKNPSFEEKTGCPNYRDRGNKQEYISHASYWTDVIKELRDAPIYYNYDPACFLTLIQPEMQFHRPRTGDAMMNLMVWGPNRESLLIAHQSKCYLRGELKEPMVANRKYFVSYHVRLHDNHALENKESGNTGINSLGIHFCDTQFFFGAAPPYVDTLVYDLDEITPQLLSNRFWLDTVQFEEVTGIYQAKGGERYITMGNFLDNIATKLKTIPNSGPGFGQVSYYLDDITIAPLPDLGADTCLATGHKHVLKVPSYVDLPDFRFTWSTGAKGKSLEIDKPGTYWVYYEMGYTKVYDTIVIRNTTQRIQLKTWPRKLHICEDSIVLTVPLSGAKDISWQNGQRSPSYTVRKAGNYRVNYTVGACRYRENTQIAFPQPSIKGVESLYCFQQDKTQYIKIAPSSQYDYAYWLRQDGRKGRAGDSLGHIFNGNWHPKNQSIYVQGWLKGCSMIDTFTIGLSKAGVIELPSSRVLCERSTLGSLPVLEPQSWTYAGENTDILWNTGSTDSIIHVNKADTYWVRTVNQEGCVFSDTSYFGYLDYTVKDQVICQHDTLTFTLDSAMNTYPNRVDWYAGEKRLDKWEDQATVPMTDTGQYAVRIQFKNTSISPYIFCNVYDTFQFSFDSITQVLGADTSVCNGQAIELSTLEDFDRYVWSTGDSANNISVKQAGKIWVKVSRNNCVAEDSVQVSYDSLWYTGPKDTAICDGDTISLVVKTPEQVTWMNQISGAQFWVSDTGTFHYRLANDQCTVHDSVSVTFVAPQNLHAIGIDTTLCHYDTFQLLSLPQPVAAFLVDGYEKTLPMQFLPGSYSVKQVKGCDTLQETLVVHQAFCGKPYFIPTAFSPNNDHLNETWKPIFNRQVIDYEIAIFSRNGTRVFQSSDTATAWDGRFHEKTLPTGAYTYVLHFSYVENGQKHANSLTGSVLLIR